MVPMACVAPFPSVPSIDETMPLSEMFTAVGADAGSPVHDSCREAVATGATASGTAASVTMAPRAVPMSAATVTTRCAGRDSTGDPRLPRQKRPPRQRRPSRLRLWRCDHPGCTMTSKKKYNLENHKRKHTGERKHECTGCGARFLWHSGLRTHNVRGRCDGSGTGGSRDASTAATTVPPPVAPAPPAAPPHVAAAGHLWRDAPPGAVVVATGGQHRPLPPPLGGRGEEDAAAPPLLAVGWEGLLPEMATAGVSTHPSLSVCGGGENSRGVVCGSSGGGVMTSMAGISGLPLATAWASGWHPAADDATATGWVPPPPSLPPEPPTTVRGGWSSTLSHYESLPARNPTVSAAIISPVAASVAVRSAVQPTPPLAEWPPLDTSSPAAAADAIPLAAPAVAAAAPFIPAAASVDGGAVAPAALSSQAADAARRAATAALAAAAVAATAVDEGEWEVVPPSTLLL